MKTLQAEIALMHQDMSHLKEKDEKLEKEKLHLENLLTTAIKQLHPEKSIQIPGNLTVLNDNDLEEYLQQLSS